MFSFLKICPWWCYLRLIKQEYFLGGSPDFFIKKTKKNKKRRFILLINLTILERVVHESRFYGLSLESSTNENCSFTLLFRDVASSKKLGGGTKFSETPRGLRHAPTKMWKYRRSEMQSGCFWRSCKEYFNI